MELTEEYFLVDNQGEKTTVVLDLDRYNRLKCFENLIDLSEILSSLNEILEKRPLDVKALDEFLEDITL